MNGTRRSTGHTVRGEDRCSAKLSCASIARACTGRSEPCQSLIGGGSIWIACEFFVNTTLEFFDVDPRITRPDHAGSGTGPTSARAARTSTTPIASKIAPKIHRPWGRTTDSRRPDAVQALRWLQIHDHDRATRERTGKCGDHGPDRKQRRCKTNQARLTEGLKVEAVCVRLHFRMPDHSRIEFEVSSPDAHQRANVATIRAPSAKESRGYPNDPVAGPLPG